MDKIRENWMKIWISGFSWKVRKPGNPGSSFLTTTLCWSCASVWLYRLLNLTPRGKKIRESSKMSKISTWSQASPGEVSTFQRKLFWSKLLMFRPDTRCVCWLGSSVPSSPLTLLLPLRLTVCRWSPERVTVMPLFSTSFNAFYVWRAETFFHCTGAPQRYWG